MGIEKIADRIRKLLALAGNNPSPEEAAAAFARAQELATKYALRLDDVAAGEVREERSIPTAEDMVTRCVFESAKYVAWRGSVADVVATANLCGWYRTGGHIFLYGLPESVELATVMFNFVCAQIDELAKFAVRSREAAELGARRYGRGFRLGCSDTVRARLKDSLGHTLRAAETEATGSTALVRVERAKAYVEANMAALAKRAKQIGVRSGRRTYCAKAAYEAGRVAGHRVSLTARALGGAR